MNWPGRNCAKVYAHSGGTRTAVTLALNDRLGQIQELHLFSPQMISQAELERLAAKGVRVYVYQGQGDIFDIQEAAWWFASKARSEMEKIIPEG